MLLLGRGRLAGIRLTDASVQLGLPATTAAPELSRATKALCGPRG